MTRLVAGANAPDIALPAIDGTTFKMADYLGKRVILTFFRFSSCPFCNIRINRIIKRWNEFSDDTVMVGVFDAKIGELTKRMKKHNAHSQLSQMNHTNTSSRIQSRNRLADFLSVL